MHLKNQDYLMQEKERRSCIFMKVLGCVIKINAGGLCRSKMFKYQQFRQLQPNIILKGKSPFLNLTCSKSSTNSLQESNEIANPKVLSKLYLRAIIQLSLETGKTWSWAWVQAWDAFILLAGEWGLKLKCQFIHSKSVHPR